MKKESIFKERKHFLFLGVIPSFVFLVLVLGSLSWMEGIHQTNTMQDDLNSAYQMFYGELYQEAKLIGVLADQISETKELQGAFLDNNRELLLSKVKPIFLDNRTDYDISHLYFHSLDRTNFLRAYAPNHYGDIINRFTLKEAERTGTISYGLELGTLEGLTLRVVLPWRINDRIVGYIELAKDIDKVIDELKKILDIELVLIVDKALLKEKQWRMAKARGNVNGDWDHFPDSIVVGTTLPKIPAILDKDLSRPHYEHKDIYLTINLEGRHYLGGFAPLLDASDKDIGDIIIIKDFTELKNVEQRIHSYLVIGYFLSALCYLLFIFIYLRRLKNRPHNSRSTDITDVA